MKKPYRTPYARKIDYSFDEQIAATSPGYPVIGNGAVGYPDVLPDTCTWNADEAGCDNIYYSTTKSMYDCTWPTTKE